MNAQRKTIPEQLSEALDEIERLKAAANTSQRPAPDSEALAKMERLNTENLSLRAALAGVRADLAIANAALASSRTEISNLRGQCSATTQRCDHSACGTPSAASAATVKSALSGFDANMSSDQLRQRAMIDAFVDRKAQESALLARSIEFTRKKLGIT